MEYKKVLLINTLGSCPPVYIMIRLRMSMIVMMIIEEICNENDIYN